MNRRKNDQIFDAVAGDYIADNIDITNRIITVISLEARSIRNARISRYAVLVMMISLLLVIVCVPQVTSAMRQMFGFLPGVGLVDLAMPIRVLQEPVSQERNGVVVTIEQVTALPDRTVIRYKVSGIPQSAYPGFLPGSDAQGFRNPCIEPLFLRLPDGKALTYTGYNAISGTQNVPQYEQNFTVMPVPGNVDTVTLVMPCIDGTELEAIPGIWEIPLRLIATSETANLSPVYDLPTPMPDRFETTILPSVAGIPSERDIWLTLDQVVVLPDGYQVYGKLNWAEDTLYSALGLEYYTMTDAQGKQIPFFQISPDPSTMPDHNSNNIPNYIPLAFQVEGPITQPGPFTLKLDGLYAAMHIKDKNTRFTFDTGTDPHENQQWVLNQNFQVENYTFRVVSVTRLADGYEFSIESDPDVACVDLSILGANHVSGECEQGIRKVHFDGETPSGMLTVFIANLDVRLTGTWQATWQPPESMPSEK